MLCRCNKNTSYISDLVVTWLTELILPPVDEGDRPVAVHWSDLGDVGDCPVAVH